MGFKNIVKKSVTGGLDIRRWIGLNQIKANGAAIKDLGAAVFAKNKNKVRNETFEECMHRLGLSENDLKVTMKNSVKVILFCLSLAAAIFCYLIYMIMHYQILGSFLCFMVILFLLANAFREHFNLFQMKQRRLGCSYKEWFESLFKGSKNG